MSDTRGIIPIGPNRPMLAKALADSNALSARYGLTLGPAEIHMLLECQQAALRDSLRVEFGSGPYEKLIYAFCDSPYLSQSGYAETLATLCVLFYRFKEVSGERWSDDELIEAMAEQFNGPCQGSMELMADRLWQGRYDPPEDAMTEDEEGADEG